MIPAGYSQNIALLQADMHFHISNLSQSGKVPQYLHSTLLTPLLWFDGFRGHEGKTIKLNLEVAHAFIPVILV